MKVIAIGGYPGSGKSTIMRAIIKHIETNAWSGRFEETKKNTVDMLSLGDIDIVGKYAEGELFPGTDKLSMSVQPKVIEYISYLIASGRNRVVLFEGDRLFNDKMLTYLLGNPSTIETAIYIIETDPDLLETRRNNRSDQNDSWRKGRKTKIDNIFSKHNDKIIKLSNNTDEDIKFIVNVILTEIGN